MIKIKEEVSLDVVLDDTLAPQPTVTRWALGWDFDRSDLEAALGRHEWGKGLVSLPGGPVVFSACMGDQPWQGSPGKVAWVRVGARSERSLIDRVNHNCVIVGASLHRKYGLILNFVKRSTGHLFHLDLPMVFRQVDGFDTDVSVSEPDHNTEGIIISRGKGFCRFEAPAHVLDSLAPSTRGIIDSVGRALNGALVHWNGEMSFQIDILHFCNLSASPLYK